MLVKMFELVDNVDYWYRSLVILKEPMKLEDIKKLVEDVKDKKGRTEYTYDDVFDVLEPLAIDIIDLYSAEKVYY